MGFNVTDDKDLVIKISSQQGGGTRGQLIISDIEFGKEQDNTEHSGIGNEGTTGVGYGNETYNLNATTIANGATADLIRTIEDNDYVEGWIRTPNNEFSAGELHPNDWTYSASDDGDIEFTVDCIVTNPNVN